MSIESPTDHSVIFINRAHYRAHARQYASIAKGLDRHTLYDKFTACLPTGGRILDVGCGAGCDSVRLIRRGYHADAIDASAEMVRIANARGAHASLLPVQRLAVVSAYDGAWASASLLHIPKAEMRGVLLRVFRAVRPGGILFISLREGRGEGIQADGRYLAFYSLGEILGILRPLELAGKITAFRSMNVRAGRTSRSLWIYIFVRRRPNPGTTSKIRGTRSSRSI